MRAANYTGASQYAAASASDNRTSTQHIKPFVQYMIAKKILEGNSHLSLGVMPKSPPQASEMLQSPFKVGVDLINIHE